MGVNIFLSLEKSVRKLDLRDLDAVKTFIVDAAVFKDYEVQDVLKSMEHYARYPDSDELLTYVYVIDNEVIGFISFGLGLGQKTYEVYWICVSPMHQGKGVGSSLLKYAEEYVQKSRGRIIFIETSSKKEYERARLLYERMGYSMSAVVRDYFDDGDDKIVYSKTIPRLNPLLS